MENTPLKNQSISSDKVKQKGFSRGFLLTIIIIFFVVITVGIVFVFSDVGATLFSKTNQSDKVETEVNVVDENNTSKLTVENEGWALYSIPEYNFSVEIPNTSEYNQEFDQYMRWEISRSKLNKYSVDSLEQIHLDYYPSGFSPEARGCGQGCNGEAQITVYIYDKDTQYNLQEVKIDKQEEIDHWNGLWEEDEGYEPVTLDEYVKDSDPFNEDVWCVNLPEIADGNFRECYFEKGNYLIEIVHTGLDLTEAATNSMSAEIYKILKTMKFE